MDCLLANYASSDEEEHEEQQQQQQQLKPPLKPVKLKSESAGEEGFLSLSSSKPGGICNSLSPPKSSLFSSLPRPKSQSLPNHMAQPNFEQQEQIDDQILDNSKPKSSSSLFSSLPPPKPLSSSSSSTSKKVVQFRPPTILNPYSISGKDEDEDEDEGEKERQRKRSKESVSTSSIMSFLSSIPAPRHSATLGSLPSASGTGRRSMIETDAPVSTDSVTGSESVVSSNVGFFKDQSSEMKHGYSSRSLGSESYANDSGYGAGHGENVASAALTGVMDSDAGVNTNVGSSEIKSDELNYDYSSRSSRSENYYNDSSAGHSVNVGPGAVDYSYGNGAYVEYTNYGGSYGDYCNDAQYKNNLADASIESALPEVSGVVEMQVPGKRGRKDTPQQIVEVIQDELMKNRPREDQVKMTGIAFGPAYQPTSTKGKPSKLHKRKHQIGSLFFDMKQKEMELAERRSKGYATKAQTQAKYGW